MNERPQASSPDVEHLRTLYREATRGVSAGSHPSENEWVRLAADELTADERTIIADHIVACHECRDTYRVVMDVRQQASSTTASAIQAVRPSDDTTVLTEVPLAALSWRWQELALAATLLVAIGAGLWGWSLRSRVGALEGQLATAQQRDDVTRLEAELRQVEERAARLEDELAAQQQPGINAPIVDLEPEVARGTERRGTEVVVPDGARYVTLVFTFTTGTAPGSPFSVEISRPDGTRIGAWPGVAPSAFQTTSVVVPIALIPPGDYTVRLLDASGASMQTHVLLVRGDGARGSSR